MTRQFSTTKVPEIGTCDTWHGLDSFLAGKFRNLTSTTKNAIPNFNELKYYWEAWHDRIGPSILKLYPEFAALSNKAAKKQGKRDTGQIWRDRYGPNTRKVVDKIWSKIKPFYHLLHGYVRYRLNRFRLISLCRI